eukprot:scaffold241_cov340-Pavlova_lutheri.AAC.34
MGARTVHRPWCMENKRRRFSRESHPSLDVPSDVKQQSHRQKRDLHVFSELEWGTAEVHPMPCNGYNPQPCPRDGHHSSDMHHHRARLILKD